MFMITRKRICTPIKHANKIVWRHAHAYVHSSSYTSRVFYDNTRKNVSFKACNDEHDPHQECSNQTCHLICDWTAKLGITEKSFM